MKDYSKEIRGYASKNALEFGKADAGKILPKLFQHGLKREDIKEIMPKIQKVVDEINSSDEKSRKKTFREFGKFIKEREEKERDLAELPNVKEKMVFRAAPFPSGALHLGNAKTFILNSLYAEKYNGKLILVIDDTIGSAEKPIDKESYDLIIDAFKFLKIKYSGKVIYKSKRLKTYYKYAEELIKKEEAYVCRCSAEKMRELRAKGAECGCRQISAGDQTKRWKEMFKMKEGEATLRIKTSMVHSNPAFRDRVLFKISERKHVLVGMKYKVWPTLEMSWAIDDHLLGITHIIRGNDLMIESDMERYIWRIFGWEWPEIIHTGLVNIKGVKISKSKARDEVKSKKFTGWDDPRTWSIQSLRRRGIRPESIREFVEDIGLNKQDITVPIESLYAINRKALDPSAERFSFVKDPVKLKIINMPDWKSVQVPKHPDKPEKRKASIGEIYVSKEDVEKYSGKEIRLLHLFNIKLGEENRITSVDLKEENKKTPKINWVSDFSNARVLMPSGEWIDGFIDSSVKSVKKGAVIQLERFGFVRLDNIQKKTYEFWFSHK